MALAVKSSVRIERGQCDMCGRIGEVIQVDTYHNVVTLCLTWPEKGRRCFDKRFPHSIVECESSGEKKDESS